MLAHEPLGFPDCQDIWAVTSIKRLEELYETTNEQKHLGRSSIWIIRGIPRSYLQNGYCTAAIRAYQEFLIQHAYENDLLERYANFVGEAQALPKHLDRKLTVPKNLLDEWQGQEGKETLRTIKARFNQNVFRKITLENYQNACCITGNPLPQLLTASHIKPWAASKANEKLNPANGLCLAKTQDAAFDKGLITLDERLRVVLSKSIRDHMTVQSIKENFIRLEGKEITQPLRFPPSQTFLEYHRETIFVA
ncbi:HNH endonuclease [Pelagicoccus mobilis]|uniref:HNH endonuclease n=2 Tax=Pelagicoccus mobilis TaxID=415221 RepID=A0A934RYR1_9BACT|nr:HNH endonuclease [Pelagicoccus mobilis]MBK1877965.1 HNH endonuclease [Pelagicoccus mobilis]